MNVPMFLAIGKAIDRPVVKDGKITIAPILYVNNTIDHRYIDAGKGKNFQHAFADVFEHPEKYFDVPQKKYSETTDSAKSK
jgi:pyruvate/2-oxoglutarate dehydrogenase complex dihydrolipoamide acyltransferase (E2) component